MKLLKKITDKEILGQEGLSGSKPRFTARAILKTDDEFYAIMYSEKFNFYSLPGGGIEENEDVITALRREIWEETGCECDTISELGYVYENRAHCDFTQYSYYFIVTTKNTSGQTQLTDNEKASQMSVQWHSIEDIVRLIVTPVHDTNQRKFIQAKDTAALNEYLTVYRK